MSRSPLASLSRLAVIVALTVAPAFLSVTVWPTHPAHAAVGEVFLPNITKTLGGQGGWTTPIVVQNIGEAPTDVALTFYRFSDGKSVATVTMPGLRPGQSRTFDPRADVRLPDDTQFSTVVQAASGQVAVAVVEGSGTSWMGYSGTPTGASTVYLPNITRNLGGRDGWNTPFIVQNLGAKKAVATVSFYNFAAGTLAKRIDNVALEPGRSQAFLTWAIDGLADDAQYAVVVQGPADSQLYAIVNEVSGGMAMSYEGLVSGSEVVYLPNVLKYLGGTDHWFTPFIVQNIGAAPATFNVEFYSFETGAIVTTLFGQQLQPGRSLPVDVRFNPVSLPAGSYSVVVRGNAGAKLGAIVNEVDPGAGMAMSYDGIAKSEAQASAFLPYLQKTAGAAGWFSPIVTQNLGTTPADLTLTLFDSNGDIATQKLFPAVKPGAAAVYDPRADRRLKNGTYSGLVQSNGAPISAVVNIAGALRGDYAMAFTSAAAPQRPIPLIPPTNKTVGGVTLALKSSNAADTYVESSIESQVMAQIATQVDADVAQIEKDFARQFRTIPTMYVFAAEQSYAQGMQTLLGYSADRAGQASKSSIAMYSPAHNLVLANWDGVSDTLPRTAFRHELTHLLLAQIVNTNPTMPAWFNEGLAVSEELTLPGSKWIGMLQKYRTLSMAINNQLIPLSELDSPTQWSLRTSPASSFQYAESQQAVEMLKADVGQAGINRILELMGQGQSFQHAFATVTGKPFADFAAAFPSRVKAIAPAVPGIAWVDDSPIGPGLSFIYYGFAPLSAITVDARSNAYGATITELANIYGTGWKYLGPNFPPGQYNLTVGNGVLFISVVARKS
jgi:hypothetical protein